MDMHGIRIDVPTDDELQNSVLRAGFDLNPENEAYHRGRTYVLCTKDDTGREQRYIVVAGFFAIEENDLKYYENNL